MRVAVGCVRVSLIIQETCSIPVTVAYTGAASSSGLPRCVAFKCRLSVIPSPVITTFISL